MKKVFPIILSAILVLSVVFYALLGVDFENEDSDVEILRVYNWEEYISEDDEDPEIDMITRFETYCREELGRNVKVEYSTFGTCENMYNELNLSKKQIGDKVTYSYDLVCPSDYMILKMLNEDMLEPIDHDGLPNYHGSASGFIQNLFKDLKSSDGQNNLYDYAMCYMWGTMGFVYNPELVDEEDAQHWTLLWNEDYKGGGTIKDSVRDSYILALGYCYQDELFALLDQYRAGDITQEEYNAQLTEIYNRTDDESIALTGEALTTLKDLIYGYEVDSGKKEMAQGKISINFAWSGDAVYTLDIAEEDGTILNYALPEEGSNIFFDGWAMPKGANVELAELFVDFLSRPDNAQLNMEYIGYTSSIASDVMFENAVDWYGYTKDDVTERDGSYFVTVEGEDGEEDEEVEVFPVDLSYFFDNLEEYDEAIIYTEELGRQFSTQYPDWESVARCTVMKCFTDDEIRTLNNMWETAKVGNTSPIVLILILVIAIVVIAGIIVVYKLYKAGKFREKDPDGYTLVKYE